MAPRDLETTILLPSRPLQRRDRHSGAALLAVLMLMFVSLSFGLLSGTSSRTEMQVAGNSVLSLRALAVAEAGISQAKKLIGSVRNLNAELAPNATGACVGMTGNTADGVGNALSGLSQLGSLATLTEADGTLRCYRSATFGGGTYYLRVEDNHDETSGADVPLTDTDNVIVMIAHGIVGSAERIVITQIQISSGFGIYATGTSPADCDPCIDLNGQSYLDSYIGVPPSTFSNIANAGTNGNIGLSGGAQIRGNAQAVGTISKNGTAAVLGTQTPGAAPITYPPVAACGPPYSGAGGIHGGSYNPATGAYKITGGATASIDPGSYCFSTLSMSGNSTIVLSGMTTLNMTGLFDTTGGSISNTTSDSSTLQLFSSAVGSNGVFVAGGSGTFMQVYAPKAAIVVTGNSDYYGSMIGLSITDAGGARIHQDNNALGLVSLVNWREVQN